MILPKQSKPIERRPEPLQPGKQMLVRTPCGMVPLCKAARLGLMTFYDKSAVVR